jgi:hypothetical protein
MRWTQARAAAAPGKPTADFLNDLARTNAL